MMSRTFRFLLLALLAALLMAGCAPLREVLHLPTQTPAVPDEADGEANEQEKVADAELRQTVDANEAEALLTFLAYVRTLSSGEKDLVYQELNKQFSKNPDQETRLRLALLRIQPGRSFTDFSEGQKLLHDYGQEALEQGRAGPGALALLLEDLSREHVRLAEELADEKRTNEHLARQLNELKNIENILRSREVESLPGM